MTGGAPVKQENYTVPRVKPDYGVVRGDGKMEMQEKEGKISLFLAHFSNG